MRRARARCLTGEEVMKKTYRLVLEIVLEQSDEQKAIRIARGHYRKGGAASTPVDWNRKGGKWKRITAEEFIPDAEIAIMELSDANDLLDEAGHRDHEC